MKKIVLLLFFLSAYPDLHAQDSLTRWLLNDAIRSRERGDTVFYIDSSITFGHKFSELAKKGEIQGGVSMRSNQVTRMRFTKRELREADRKFAGTQVLQWPDSLLPVSIRMNRDSINRFISYMAGPAFQKATKYRWYFLFSQPVFIRNNNIAIIRVAEMINSSAGYILLLVYEKEGNGWKRKMFITESAI